MSCLHHSRDENGIDMRHAFKLRAAVKRFDHPTDGSDAIEILYMAAARGNMPTTTLTMWSKQLSAASTNSASS